MRKLILILLVAASLILMTGCNLVGKLLEIDILERFDKEFIEEEEEVRVEMAPEYLTADGIITYEEEEIIETDIRVEINGEVLKYDPRYNKGEDGEAKVIMFRERSLVPLRELAGELGYEISWEGAGQKQALYVKGNIEVKGEIEPMIIIGKMNSNEFEISIGNRKETIYSETPTIKYDGKIYVPLRFIGETLGVEVNWLGDEKKVDFITK